MIRRPPRATLDRSSAASDVYKRQLEEAFVRRSLPYKLVGATRFYERKEVKDALAFLRAIHNPLDWVSLSRIINVPPVSYTHLRAHETVLDLVCRLLLEKKKTTKNTTQQIQRNNIHTLLIQQPPY